MVDSVRMNLNLNLSHLKTFAAVVRFGSISGAAARLHLSQPAVTKHVQALEGYYGRPLLERAGREVSPNEEGKILFRHIQDVLRMLDAAEAAMAEAGASVQGPLHLGASTIPGQYVLPHVICAFRRAYPLVDHHLEIADTAQIAWQVAENRLDVGVVGSPVRDRRLESFPFWEDELVVIMPVGHPLAARPTIAARDLAGQALVWRESGSGTRKTVEERLAGAGITLDTGTRVLEVGSTEAVVAAVEAGLGISVVSCLAVQKSCRLGVVEARSLVDVSLKRDLYVLYPRQGCSRAAAAFADFLRGPAGKEVMAVIRNFMEPNRVVKV